MLPCVAACLVPFSRAKAGLGQVASFPVQLACERCDRILENRVRCRVGRQNTVERKADAARLAEQRGGHDHLWPWTRPLNLPAHRQHRVGSCADPVVRLSPATLAHTRLHQPCHLRVRDSGRPATHDLERHRPGLRLDDRSRDCAGVIEVGAGAHDKSDASNCGQFATRQNSPIHCSAPKGSVIPAFTGSTCVRQMSGRFQTYDESCAQDMTWETGQIGLGSERAEGSPRIPQAGDAAGNGRKCRQTCCSMMSASCISITIAC